MTIEPPSEVETQLKEAARSQGVSVSQYVERLVAETNLRRMQVAELRAAIAERMASLNAGDAMDGEEVMDRLIAHPASQSGLTTRGPRMRHGAEEVPISFDPQPQLSLFGAFPGSWQSIPSATDLPVIP